MEEKKKVNTALLMVILTLLNLLLIVVIFLVLSVILGLIAAKTGMSDSLYTVLAMVVITLSFVLSFLIYRKIVAWAGKKWDLGRGRDKRRE